MTREGTRFYEARFLLQWASQQAGELEKKPRHISGDRRSEDGFRPTAFSAITNYRMALELIAHEVASVSCPHSRPDRVSFPVAHELPAFRSMMTTRFPALRTNHPRIWAQFLRVQGFLPNNSGWLPTLHGLWNRSIPLTRRHASGSDEATLVAGHATPDRSAAPWGLAYSGAPAGQTLGGFLRDVGVEEDRLVVAFDRLLEEM